jgi:glycosyltransferase involved in cell wall biosynthesis
MKIKNNDSRDFDFYINRKWYKFRGDETKNLDPKEVIAIIEKYPYWRFKVDKKDIDHVEKDNELGEVLIYLKNGEIIHQRKPEELRFHEVQKKLDMQKIQVGIFMKHISQHYSGGRYWAWLLGHILAEHPNIQVTFVTNMKPPFGKSFDAYDTSNLFVYESDPRNLYRMGDRIPVNVFDYIIGVPQEGGNSAMAYADKWGMPYYAMLFESPNFIRDYRTGSDSHDEAWREYVPVLENAEKVINNTEVGKEYLDKWDKLKEPYHAEKSVWLWNSINTRIADKVEQDESKGEPYNILFVGRAVEFKRQIHIIRALNLIKDKKFVVHMITSRTGGVVDQMRREAGDHIRIETHVKVDDYEKFRIIKKCNLMLFLSSFEGFGLPPMESLHCERVCISYELPILKMIYKDNLIWCKAGDYKDVAKKVREYLKPSKKKEKHIARAKEYINSISNHDRVRDDFLKIVGYDGSKIVDVDKIKEESLNFLTRKRKVTFGIIVCNGSQFILQQLNHIYDMADQIIICEGAVENFKRIIGSNYSNDGTIEKIKDFIDSRDLKHKIEFISSKAMGRAWRDKQEMQNKIAEKTKGTIFVKQDVDEFYNLDGLLKEITRLERGKGRIMINYQSIHFWGDFNHAIVGSNFNDKQTRVWKWRPSFRYNKTFNWVTDMATNTYLTPDEGNKIVSQDKLFHYSYLYKHRARGDILQYYKLRANEKMGDYQDVANACPTLF